MDTVLLLGDSIRLGYAPFVREKLSPGVQVVYPEDNGRFTQYTYIHLAGWSAELVQDPADVRVVHWNNGHWDIAHWNGDPQSLNSVAQYTEMLRRTYARLREMYANAKIIFATTTPMHPLGVQGANRRTTEEIAAYNAAAAEVMRELGVPVNDLFSLMQDTPAQLYADHCHFTEEGFRRLGARVADVISSYL